MDLPKEIWFDVFSYLDAYFLVTRVAVVCEAWGELIKEDAFWRSLRSLTLEAEQGGVHFVEKIIGKCLNLRYLKVAGSQYHRTEPICIPKGSLPYLRTLCFSYVSETCEEALRNVLQSSPRLASLSLIDNYKPLSDPVVEDIARLPELTSLEISMLYVVRREKLVRLFRSHSQCLQRVHLSIPECLDEAVVESILGSCASSLTSLALFNSFDESAFKGIVNCVKLVELKIGCAELSDESLRLVTSLPCLHTLTLEGGKLFTTGGLRSLFGGKGFNRLRNLAVVDCHAFEDSALDAVTSHYGDSLESLYIEYCPRVSNRGIVLMLKRCSSLQVLRLSGLCVNYALLLRRLHEHLPRLRLLTLLDRTVNVEDVRRFVAHHPVFKTRPCREVSDGDTDNEGDGFSHLYARCLDPRDLRPIVVFMNHNCHISALAHSFCH